jgi:cyclic 2,3-diphosphoglycerate synthase
MRRAVVLVDGEHYPPVVREALAALREEGTEPVAALFLGGTEKVARHGEAVDLGVPVAWVDRVEGARGSAPDPDAAAAALARTIAEHRPDVVVDRSDEPVVDARSRLRLASTALIAGVPYEGADFRLDPPPRPRLSARPAIAVIGTGKRTGKTAVAGELTRQLAGMGRTPVVVAMGRGGPERPVLIPAGTAPDVAGLLAIADGGGHAASDCYEDAVTTGAAVVGARRCGGGLVGAVGHSNVAEAIGLAEGQPGDILVLEGSGAALPPAHADATLLVVPGDADPELLAGYLTPYRLLLADLVVVTMSEPPRASTDQVRAVEEAIRSISRRVPVLRTVFRPHPLGQVSGSRVLFATTAPAAVCASLVESLEREHGCEVVGTSTNLADREALRRDLRAAPAFDVLLVELKAAAVDVAARVASSAGARVVLCDNRPVVVDDHPTSLLADVVGRLARLADERFAAPHP